MLISGSRQQLKRPLLVNTEGVTVSSLSSLKGITEVSLMLINLTTRQKEASHPNRVGNHLSSPIRKQPELNPVM